MVSKLCLSLALLEQEERRREDAGGEGQAQKGCEARDRKRLKGNRKMGGRRGRSGRTGTGAPGGHLGEGRQRGETEVSREGEEEQQQQ